MGHRTALRLLSGRADVEVLAAAADAADFGLRLRW
jgi:hypothetical protein